MKESAEHYVSTREIFPIIEDMLHSGQCARFVVSGNSMWPLIIHNRDSVLIRSCERGQLKPGDIILFRKGKGYMLHRIIARKQGGYITAGDGNLFTDGYVPERDVIARVVKIYRKDIVIDCNKWYWKPIVRLWICAFPVRKLFHKIIKKSAVRNK